MEAYRDFAKVYDELMDNTPYEEWAARLDRLIKKYGVSMASRDGRTSLTEKESVPNRENALLESEKNLVLDLGCGTGILTEMMYAKGYDLIGVDVSEAMLDRAIKRKEMTGSDILYLLQDMRELDLFSTVGTVYSVCDSVNYILEEEELERVFSLVQNYLFPGGVFIFDFNTEYKYREVIGETVIAENREDCSFIWENYYDKEERVNEYDLTLFIKESEEAEEERFLRFTETHYQRCYSLDIVKQLLQEAGMELVAVYDAYTKNPLWEDSEKMTIIARESGKQN